MMNKEKNVQDIENVLYNTLCCTPEEATEILNECIKNARAKMYNLQIRNGRLQQAYKDFSKK